VGLRIRRFEFKLRYIQSNQNDRGERTVMPSMGSGKAGRR
jgi:hypothetical protein